MAETILVADDDSDIRRLVELNLRLEGYEVLTAANGEEALRVTYDEAPALVLLDVMMPRLDGYEVCQRLRADGRTSHIPVIMLTARSLAADKIVGLTTGADDYIIKPFDPLELVARVKSTLRRVRQMRSISPLTGLPGNVQIEEELRSRVAKGDRIAVSYADLDAFKAFNDRYGFLRGDDAISYTAGVLRDVARERSPEAFLGHVGGDDFVLVVPPEDAEPVCVGAVDGFDRGVKGLYEPEDAARGYIEVEDRMGNLVRSPILSVSIGVATNERRTITDHRELVQIATEMKAIAKLQPGSVYALDRRAQGQAGTDREHG